MVGCKDGGGEDGKAAVVKSDWQHKATVTSFYIYGF